MRIIALVILFTLPLLAQTPAGIDFQFRSLYHLQLVPEAHRIGFASWGALSDITNAHPLKRWAAVGIAIASKERDNDQKPMRWIEVMTGVGKFYADAHISPVLDIRAQDISVPHLKLFLEVFYPTRRTDYAPSIITPLSIPIGHRRMKLWLGGEADMWWGVNATRGGGPKLVVPLGKHLALTSAYHFNTNVWRQYALYTF